MKTPFLFLAIVLILVFNVYALDDYFCFIKLKNNEVVPSITNSISSKLICENGKCTCKLDSGDGYCLICTNSSGWLASYNECNSDFCDPNETINGPLDLSVVFPFANGESFTKNRFYIEINTTRKSKIDLIDNEKQEGKNICMHCNYFRKMLFFNEGFNNISIRSSIAGEVLVYNINFFIDTKKPRIIKTFPIQNKFADGNFTLNYEENNLKNVRLYYGDDAEIKMIELNGCENGKSSCSINVDLKEFNGKKIAYWFSIVDIGNNIVNSSKIRIFVDNKKPVINSLNYELKGKDYVVYLNVNEDNFEKAVYINDDGKENLFCSSLKNDICFRKLKQVNGINIIVRDRAGNSEQKKISNQE